MKTFTFILSLVFGALFIWSGVAKIEDPITFAEAVRNFRIIGDPFAAAAALFVPWVEVFAGIGVMLDRFRTGASVILSASIIVFTTAIVFAWMHGLDISCGCFGGTEAMNYPTKVASNLGLLAVGGFIFFQQYLIGLSRRPDPI